MRPIFLLLALLVPVLPLGAQEPGRGEAVFLAVCSGCHTIDPPPLRAPPISHIARRYLAAAGSPVAARARIMAWVAAPSAERSLLPPMARERWGLMPALPLPEADLRAVSTHVVELAAAERTQRGHGHGHGGAHGMRRPHMHRMQQDSMPLR